MHTIKRNVVRWLVVLGVVLLARPVHAQWERAREDLNFYTNNLSGPRFGLTFIPAGSELSDSLKVHEINPFFSQFGWHFEQQITPRKGGPALVFELIPLIGAVESGTLLFSSTLVLGIRLPDGVEFGVGPNLWFLGTGIKSSLIIAAGKTMDYSGVNIPINLALSASNAGVRMTLLIGYAIGQPD